MGARLLMSQDRYRLVRNETEGTVKLEAGGDVIWQADGSWCKKDDDFLEAILEDANFGQPQKDALRAFVGLIPERIEDPVNDSS